MVRFYSHKMTKRRKNLSKPGANLDFYGPNVMQVSARRVLQAIFKLLKVGATVVVSKKVRKGRTDKFPIFKGAVREVEVGRFQSDAFSTWRNGERERVS